MQGVTSWKVVISLFQRNLTEANVYVKFEEDRDPIQFFQFLWLQLCFKALPYKVVRLSLTKHSRLGARINKLACRCVIDLDHYHVTFTSSLFTEVSVRKCIRLVSAVTFYLISLLIAGSPLSTSTCFTTLFTLTFTFTTSCRCPFAPHFAQVLPRVGYTLLRAKCPALPPAQHLWGQNPFDVSFSRSLTMFKLICTQSLLFSPSQPAIFLAWGLAVSHAFPFSIAAASCIFGSSNSLVRNSREDIFSNDRSLTANSRSPGP